LAGFYLLINTAALFTKTLPTAGHDKISGRGAGMPPPLPAWQIKTFSIEYFALFCRYKLINIFQL
jgi:hypothetical protein